MGPRMKSAEGDTGRQIMRCHGARPPPKAGRNQHLAAIHSVRKAPQGPLR